jgi:hypothetical protein
VPGRRPTAPINLKALLYVEYALPKGVEKVRVEILAGELGQGLAVLEDLDELVRRHQTRHPSTQYIREIFDFATLKWPTLMVKNGPP